MNNEQMLNNQVYLSGTICSEPVFSHEVLGEGFYETSLKVKRLSDQYDEIPLTISERMLTEENSKIGTRMTVSGQFRSYNKIDDGKSKLILRVFVREILEDDDEKNPNTIEIVGFVCKQPIYRTTPFKREISDMLIAVNRAYNVQQVGLHSLHSVGKKCKICANVQRRRKSPNFGQNSKPRI